MYAIVICYNIMLFQTLKNLVKKCTSFSFKFLLTQTLKKMLK